MKALTICQPYAHQGLFEINDDKLDAIATKVINQGRRRG